MISLARCRWRPYWGRFFIFIFLRDPFSQTIFGKVTWKEMLTAESTQYIYILFIIIYIGTFFSCKGSVLNPKLPFSFGCMVDFYGVKVWWCVDDLSGAFSCWWRNVAGSFFFLSRAFVYDVISYFIVYLCLVSRVLWNCKGGSLFFMIIIILFIYFLIIYLFIFWLVL